METGSRWALARDGREDEIGDEVLNEARAYAPPKAGVDPDASLSWLKRAWPVLRSHRASLSIALSLSFLGLVLQVEIPKLLNDAISKSVQTHTASLAHYVWLMVIISVAAGIMGYFARYYLMRTAYDLEYDLRNLIYDHLSGLSFGFYDTAQSGQLISRANSDIRSVQMYLTFGPGILVQCLIGVVAFCFMLSISVPLALVSMVTTPFVFSAGVRMRKTMFPVSWLIQARLADVATIVDENVNGVRVVKSFAQERHEVLALAQASDRLTWAYIKD